MSKNIKVKCNCCEKVHEEWPALTFIFPDHYNSLSDLDRRKTTEIDGDFCKINNENEISLYIRCTLTQKVTNHCEDLEYGLWVSLSEKSFEDYKQNFKIETDEKVYFGWLSNDLNDYEFTESIPMDVFTRNNGQRPKLIPHKSFEHKFVKDYYNGIDKIEAEKRISNMLNIITENENSTTKKWWRIW